MNKKIFASAMFAVVALFANAASAVTYDNSVVDTAGSYAQGGNAVIAPGGASVRLNDLVITAETGGVGADIPAGSQIIVRLPAGLNFDGEPTYSVTTADPNGLTLVDDSGFGDPTRDDPKIELFDTNGDGGMDRAVVTVAGSGVAGDELTIGINATATSSAKASALAVNGTVKASVIVNNGLAQTQEIATINSTVAEPAGALAGGTKLPTAQSAGQENVAIGGSATIVITIPAGTVGSKTITLTPGSGITWATMTSSVSAVVVHSPVAVGTTPLGAALNMGNASGTNSITLVTPGVGAPTEASKFDVQVSLTIDAINVKADTSTGVKNIVVGGTVFGTETANVGVVNVLKNGSTAELTSTTVIPGNKAIDIVKGSKAAQPLPAITVKENFPCDAVADGGAGCTAGTSTLTIQAGSGLTFAANNTSTVTVTGGTATVSVINIGLGTSNGLSISFAAGGRDGGKTIQISGMRATASSTASGNLSVTVGVTGDKTTAPKQSVVVAKAVDVGTVTPSLKDKKKKVTGPTGPGGMVTSNVKLEESTPGALSAESDTVTQEAFFRVTPSQGSTITDVTVTTTGYPDIAPMVGSTPGQCVIEDAANTSGPWVCLVMGESNEIAPGTSSLTVSIDYYGNAKSTSPIAPPAAVIGSVISMAFDGNAGLSGSVDVADVGISTKASRGQVFDLTAGETEAQDIANLTISENFPGAMSSGGKFRLIAPTGVTFQDVDLVASSVSPTTAFSATPSITATFSPNDTIVLSITGSLTAVQFDSQAVIGPNVPMGFIPFQIVDGGIDGQNGAGVTAESINLGYVDGSLAPFKAGDDVDLNAGFQATNMLTGGLAPYQKPTSSDSAVATAKVIGDKLVITAIAAGNATITVKDTLDDPEEVEVVVSAGAAQPAVSKVKGDPNTTATFGAGVSKDGGDTFTEDLVAGDEVTIVGTINVDEDDQGVDGAVYVAILSQPASGGSTLSYLNEEGVPEAWDGTVSGLGAHIVAEPLGDTYYVTVFSGALAEGKYRVALAYATEDGKLIYAPKAVIIEVAAE